MVDTVFKIGRQQSHTSLAFNLPCPFDVSARLVLNRTRSQKSSADGGPLPGPFPLPLILPSAPFRFQAVLIIQMIRTDSTSVLLSQQSRILQVNQDWIPPQNILTICLSLHCLSLHLLPRTQLPKHACCHHQFQAF